MFGYLEKFDKIFKARRLQSVSIFSLTILVSLLLSLWCFPIFIVNKYFSFNLKVIFYEAKISQNDVTRRGRHNYKRKTNMCNRERKYYESHSGLQKHKTNLTIEWVYRKETKEQNVGDASRLFCWHVYWSDLFLIDLTTSQIKYRLKILMKTPNWSQSS